MYPDVLRPLARFLSILVAVQFSITSVLALDASKLPTGTYVCKGIARTCGAWGANGENTCRVCKQPICKTENGGEVLAGNVNETECYEGHGPAPIRVKPQRLNNSPRLKEGVKQ
jgi:hypothetical protein